MSDVLSGVRAVGLGDLLTLLLTRTPAGKDEPLPGAAMPARDFADHLLAAAGAQGVTAPARPRPSAPVRRPVRPPGRPRPRDSAQRGCSQGESRRSNLDWA